MYRQSTASEGEESVMKRFKGVVGASVLAMIIFGFVAGVGSAATRTYTLKASLGTKSLASVKDATGANGTLTSKLTVAGKKSRYTWTLTVHHLSGPVTRASIYFSNGSKAGTLALPLCVKCQTPTAHGEYVGSYVANATFLRKILHGGAYVVVATKLNPKGEIRGQIKTTS
jgi:CHRD domain